MYRLAPNLQRSALLSLYAKITGTRHHNQLTQTSLKKQHGPTLNWEHPWLKAWIKDTRKALRPGSPCRIVTGDLDYMAERSPMPDTLSLTEEEKQRKLHTGQTEANCVLWSVGSTRQQGGKGLECRSYALPLSQIQPFSCKNVSTIKQFLKSTTHTWPVQRYCCNPCVPWHSETQQSYYEWEVERKKLIHKLFSEIFGKTKWQTR